jgi:hypothetical protein
VSFFPIQLIAASLRDAGFVRISGDLPALRSNAASMKSLLLSSFFLPTTIFVFDRLLRPMLLFEHRVYR